MEWNTVERAIQTETDTRTERGLQLAMIYVVNWTLNTVYPFLSFMASRDALREVPSCCSLDTIMAFCWTSYITCILLSHVSRVSPYERLWLAIPSLRHCSCDGNGTNSINSLASEGSLNPVPVHQCTCSFSQTEGFVVRKLSSDIIPSDWLGSEHRLSYSYNNRHSDS